MRSRMVGTESSLLASCNGGTPGGGGGGGVPIMFSSTHLPRSTGDVRLAYEVASRMLPWPSRPPRTLSGRQRHAPELRAVNVRHAVVLRQALIEERVVGPQQVEHAAVLLDDALEKELGLLTEGPPQIVVEHREHPPIGHNRGEIPQIQPLSGEVVDQRFRARVRQHPPNLLLEHLRIAQLSASREVEELVVGNRCST